MAERDEREERDAAADIARLGGDPDRGEVSPREYHDESGTPSFAKRPPDGSTQEVDRALSEREQVDRGGAEPSGPVSRGTSPPARSDGGA